MDFAENNSNGSININQVTVSEKVAAKALDAAFIEEQKGYLRILGFQCVMSQSCPSHMTFAHQALVMRMSLSAERRMEK